MQYDIRRAVIPAAGLGTRFLPITKAQPKEMLPVVDKPVIQYVVEEAIDSGIDDILIITGRRKGSIEDHFDDSFELKYRLGKKNNTKMFEQLENLSNMANIHFIRQKDPKGLGDALIYARHHCDDEPFVVMLGDTITIPDKGENTCVRQMVDTFKKYKKPIIAVEKIPQERIKDYGIIDGEALEDGIYKVRDIVEKPAVEDAPSNLGAIGRYILTPEIFELLKKTKSGHGGEVQLTDALRQLKEPLGMIVKCRRYDIGDKLGWMKSSIELALERKEFSSELKTFLMDLLSTQ